MNPDTLASALETISKRQPESVALVSKDARITYGQLGASISHLTNAYRHLGIERGDRIVCCVSNRPEYILALGAAWESGGVHVGVDYKSTAAELDTILALTQGKALIYEPVDDAPDPLQPLLTLRQNHPDILLFVVGDWPLPSGCLSLSEEVISGFADSEATDTDGPAPPDPAMIFISSGTTGKPKAALGFHGNLCQRWRRLGAWLKFGPNDVHLAQLPLAHGFGLMMAVSALLSGGRLILLRRYSPEEALQAIGKEQVTVFNGAPTHFKLLLDRLDSAPYDLPSLRLSVGTAAAFSSSLVQAIWERLGVDFMFMYGSSEAVGVATTDRDDILKGSVGRPDPEAVAIVGPDRRPLFVGEVGEIAFSRKSFPVRYWGEGTGDSPSSDAPLKMSDTQDGLNTWYYSGDLGRLDEEGRLYVYGRLKHQIDRGGLKVDPVEVENALLRCPEVSDAAAIGIPNPILGEVVCACVVPTTEYRPSLDTLRAALATELAPYKLPEALYVLSHIPRTQLGKVDIEPLRAAVMKDTDRLVVRR